MDSRTMAWAGTLSALALARAVLAGPLQAPPWPDGCVDRVEEPVVVVVVPAGVEVEVIPADGAVPPEGACFQSNRRSPRLEALRRARATALQRALLDDAEPAVMTRESSDPERTISLTTTGPCP